MTANARDAIAPYPRRLLSIQKEHLKVHTREQHLEWLYMPVSFSRSSHHHSQKVGCKRSTILDTYSMSSRELTSHIVLEPVGIIYVVMAAMLILISIARRRQSMHDFADKYQRGPEYRPGGKRYWGRQFK